MMKLQLRFLTIVALASLLLSGCRPLLRSVWPRTPTPAPAADTPVPPTETPSPEEAGESTGECAHVWDNRPLDVETTMVQAAFEAAGIRGVRARLSAYGENCIDPDTNQVVRFMTMETDFYLTIEMASLEDPGALGNKLGDCLDVLLGFPEDTFPGPNPGRVFAGFAAGEETLNLSFDLRQAEEAQEKNLRGSRLIDALK